MEFQPLPEKLRKEVRSLHQKKYRDEVRLFLAEGPKIADELSRSSYSVRFLVVRNNEIHVHSTIINHYRLQGTPIYSATPYNMEYMSDTKTPQGILAIAEYPDEEGQSPEQSTNVFSSGSFIALDAVNDPGNVGTIIRTAHWFGIKNIVLGQGCADRYNPKVIRSTMGSLFYCNVSDADLPTLLADAPKGFSLYGASPEATIAIRDILPQKNFGVIIGSESHGISREVEKLLHQSYTIEGAGGAESLNAAVAAGISLYHFAPYMK